MAGHVFVVGRLARLSFDVPEQHLSISLRRIPARPADGVVLRVRS